MVIRLLSIVGLLELKKKKMESKATPTLYSDYKIGSPSRASSTFSSLLNSARRDVLKEVDENVARNSSRAEKKKEAKAAANEDQDDVAVSLARELEVAEAAEESIRRKALRDLDERDRRHALALAEKRNQEYDPVAAAWAAVDANELAAQAAAELEDRDVALAAAREERTRASGGSAHDDEERNVQLARSLIRDDQRAEHRVEKANEQSVRRMLDDEDETRAAAAYAVLLRKTSATSTLRNTSHASDRADGKDDDSDDSAAELKGGDDKCSSSDVRSDSKAEAKGCVSTHSSSNSTLRSCEKEEDAGSTVASEQVAVYKEARRLAREVRQWASPQIDIDDVCSGLCITIGPLPELHDLIVRLDPPQPHQAMRNISINAKRKPFVSRDVATFEAFDPQGAAVAFGDSDELNTAAAASTSSSVSPSSRGNHTATVLPPVGRRVVAAAALASVATTAAKGLFKRATSSVASAFADVTAEPKSEVQDAAAVAAARRAASVQSAEADVSSIRGALRDGFGSGDSGERRGLSLAAAIELDASGVRLVPEDVHCEFNSSSGLVHVYVENVQTCAPDSN